METGKNGIEKKTFPLISSTQYLEKICRNNVLPFTCYTLRCKTLGSCFMKMAMERHKCVTLNMK